MRRKLFKLTQEQMVEAKPLFPAASTSVESKESPSSEGPEGSPGVPVSSEPGPSTRDPPSANADLEVSSSLDNTTWEDLTEDERATRLADEYNRGGYSPVLTREEDLPLGTEVVDPIDDAKRVEFSRVEYEKSGRATSQQDATLEAKAREGMDGDEAQFSVEAPVEQQTYLWSDKYRPRKPRYFNRVHTGFEWNKYNQTHYDLDNPPPKIVQGYKFNIFYPDLLDTSKAPTFELSPVEDNPDFAILRFTAGVPYEDIAFKVVNREWEIAHRKGYRCQFQNGIFQLWYHFKKYRYRR